MTRDELVAIGEICRAARPLADLRRGLRRADVRGRARRRALAAGYRRSRGLGLEPLEVALDDRLARRLGDRARRARRAPGLPLDVHAVRLAGVHPGRRRSSRSSTQLDEVGELHELYRERAAAIVDEFAQLGPMQPRMPEGGMFLMLDIRPTGPQRRRVRAPAARGGGRLGAARRGLRAERRGARAHLRDDRRDAPARGLPADRALRRSARRGDRATRAVRAHATAHTIHPWPIPSPSTAPGRSTS